MPTTLVTGATGFVGSHVARALVARGDDVRVTVRATSRLEPLKGLDVETVVADVTDRRAVRRALRGVERGFPLAGAAHPRIGARRPFPTNPDGAPAPAAGGPRAGGERGAYTP